MPYNTYTQPATSSPPTTTGCGCGCGGCPTCHSLQCLCRPRFFAGQLVTDADFRRLDDYLVGKARLHNRYLHGTGVVCGLEAVCNPCDDTVTVRPGYALGPCGEDIVVCADTRVPVAELIKALRQSRSRDCGPFQDQPPDCEAATQRWILNICYDEQPARPVTTLTPTRSSACSGGCSGGCGGSGSGDGCGCGASISTSKCGCGSATTTTGSGSPCGCNSASSSTPTRTPAACEPTVICEGFRFTLTKEPIAKPRLGTRDDTTVTGPLATGVKACLTSLTDAISQVPQDPTPAQLVQYCCQLKADLRAVVQSANVHDCTLGRRLADITCPDPADQEAAGKAATAITEMLRIAIDLYRECICSALLPPCPDDCCDACVPLATLTVRSADLQVLDVCNWSSRKFAVTVPMLGYWLGWLPFTETIRQTISRLCCPPETDASFRMTQNLKVSMTSQAAHAANAAAKAGAAAKASATTQSKSSATTKAAPGQTDPAAWQVAAQYLSGTNPLSGLHATVLAALGATGPDGGELASPAELADPFAALAFARVAGPAGSALATPLADPASVLVERVVARAAPDEGRIEALEKAVAALQKKVTSQTRTITSLRRGQQK